MNLFKIHFMRATLTVALIFLTGISNAQEKTSSFDKRCLWVVRSSISDPRSVDELVKFAKLNQINHLLVQIRGRGDAYYQSTLVPRGKFIADIEFDPLAYLIKKAHVEKISVHAWVNVYLVWSDSRVPGDLSHILFQHPEWLDITQAGRMDAYELTRDIVDLREGHEGLYLSPGHPMVADYLVNLFREIVVNYDIDGLHLDYIRYQDSDFGRNPIARQVYERNNGEDPWVLMSSYETWKGNERQYASRMRKWSDYRRHTITDMVKQINLMVKELRPECILSAAVKPNLYNARDQFFQEWDLWLAAGYLDWVFPMNYSVDLHDFASNIEIIYDNLPAKYRQRIIMGLATYNQNSSAVVDKLKYTRITRFPGICLFSYNTFHQDPGYIRNIYIEMNK